MASNKADNYNFGLYLEGEYTCSSSYTGYFSPEFYLRACHYGVDICNEGTS